MKNIIIIGTALLLSSTSMANAWTKIDLPAVCATTADAFKELNDEKNSPIIATKLDKILMTVWISEDKQQIVVTNTTNDTTGRSITCIVAMGNKDTMLLDDSPF
jgi:hypothetical protein